MRRSYILIACIILSACEWDARKENMMLEAENEELRLQLHLSTQYIEDVTAIIDHVQRNLQHIRDREAIIDRISLSAEGHRTRAVNVRKELMSSISDIDAYILDNRRKMELLAARISESQVRIAGLEELAVNLQASVKQKEQDIVELNIPTGVPRIYEFDTDLRPTRAEYLGDAAAIEAAAKAVADQAKG